MSFTKGSIYPPNPNTTRGIATKLGSHGDKIAYANGKSIVIRDLNNPDNVVIYSGHVQPTTVMRISPSGYYAASADASGTVRVWDTVGEDHVLKGEYKVIGGRINDLSWDGESKRIIAVGDGREKSGHVFQFDTGSSAGEISGHSKAINAVSIRRQRPFRAATAGDEGQIIFHSGVPYKYDKTIKSHTKFVQDVQFSPSGDFFVSAGSDAKVFLYDGKVGDQLSEFADAHKGTAFAVSWGPSGKSIVTSSADCTVKLWDVETRKAVTTWSLGSGVENQQVGNTWAGAEGIVSLSMGGDLNIFDRRQGDRPARILYGPQKSITSTCITSTSSRRTFFAGSADGRIHRVDFQESAVLERVRSGTKDGGHGNLVSGIAADDNNSVWSVGYDDRVREIDLTGVQGLKEGNFGPTASQPKGVAVSKKDGHVFVAEASHLEVLKAAQKVSAIDLKYAAISVDVAKNVVAVGGEDAKIHLYNWTANGVLEEAGVLEGSQKGAVSAVAFTPDGSLLAAGDSTGKIVVYDVHARKPTITRWTFHSSRIHALAWTADGAHLASGSLDTHVYIWSVAKPMKNIAIKNAGPDGVWGVNWIPEDPGENAGRKEAAGKLISAGADGSARIWAVVFHA